jgi:uncharacterized coiled-coil protein SlyX
MHKVRKVEQMKIEQKRVRHSWLTRVTTDDKSFGLQHLAEGKVRVFDPFGGSVRHNTATATDFSSLEEAMAFMEPLGAEIKGEVVDLRTDVERSATLAEALEGQAQDLEDAMAFMDPLSAEIKGEVVDLRTDVERSATLVEALEGQVQDLEDAIQEVFPDIQTVTLPGLCDLASAELARTEDKGEPK